MWDLKAVSEETVSCFFSALTLLVGWSDSSLCHFLPTMLFRKSYRKKSGNWLLRFTWKWPLELRTARHTCNGVMALCPLLDYPGEPVPGETFTNYTCPDHQSSFISFFYLLRFIASSLFNVHAWQSFCASFLQVLFVLPLGLVPSISYSIHLFTQSSFSFCNTCPYHCNLFCCSTKIMLSNPSLSLNSAFLGHLQDDLINPVKMSVHMSIHTSICPQSNSMQPQTK